MKPCEWCGHPHDVTALCPSRPLARGVTRRSFIALFAGGVAGAMLAPSLANLPQAQLMGVYPVPPPGLDIEAFGRLTEQVWESLRLPPPAATVRMFLAVDRGAFLLPVIGRGEDD